METIKDIMTTTSLQGSGASERTKKHSAGNEKDLAFQKKFGSQQKLMTCFSPDRLGYYLSDKERCLREYSPTLDKVDALFGKDTSVYILRELYLSLYRLSTVKEPFTTDTALTAASLFFGSYRRTCNLYQMMLYFAMYPAMFKGSYFQFDTTDILRQYGAKFLPWYQSQTTDDDEPQRPVARPSEPVGLEARDIYLMEQIRNGADIRQGGLYRFGFVTEWELQQLERDTI